MGRILTLKGRMDATAEPNQQMRKILDYEGVDLTRGWKVIGGEALLMSSPTSGFKGLVLHTDDIRKLSIDFSDNQVLGWIGNTLSAGSPDMGFLDPNHIIVSSLYLSTLESTAVTYMVVLEQVRITAIENVIYQLKERAQAALE